MHIGRHTLLVRRSVTHCEKFVWVKVCFQWPNIVNIVLGQYVWYIHTLTKFILGYFSRCLNPQSVTVIKVSPPKGRPKRPKIGRVWSYQDQQKVCQWIEVIGSFGFDGSWPSFECSGDQIRIRTPFSTGLPLMTTKILWGKYLHSFRYNICFIFTLDLHPSGIKMYLQFCLIMYVR